MGLRWEVGVTTHHSRAFTTLRPTVESLAQAGFESPRFFIDGLLDPIPHWFRHYRLHHRETPVFAFGNWSLALYEMVTISPDCDRYAIFQDDVLLCRNVRQYLESVPWVPKTYLNLITYPGNEGPWTNIRDGVCGFHVAAKNGWGAQGLVFDMAAVKALLTNRRFFEHRLKMNLQVGVLAGRKHIDGVVHDSLVDDNGFKELVHHPSLVTHVVEEPSAIRNKPQPKIECWAGEDFDAMSLLKGNMV